MRARDPEDGLSWARRVSRPLASFVLVALAFLGAPAFGGDPPPGVPDPVVEVEEDVYSYESPDNGSGPLWCHGSTCLARMGDEVFASGVEKIPGAKPLNNVRWTLHRRSAAGWEPCRKDETGRTREPCPLAVIPGKAAVGGGAAPDGGSVLLSVNPTLSPLDAYSGPAEPRVLKFAARDPRGAFETMVPEWDGKPEFTEHSYRSFAADGPSGEWILFQNVGYTHAEWTFRDREGKWAARGKLKWPWGADHARPEPIRVCYPTVALKDRAVHFCGVSDIVEPNLEWRAFKKELTGREWDYDFRRLFYAWSDDVRSGSFHDWVEISSRETTCGWIFPCDLWVAPDGAVHLLWSERAIDERLRSRFFPEARQRISLEHAVVRGGRVESRKAIAEALEGVPGETPGNGRFQVTEDGRLFVFYFTSGTSAEGKAVSENRVAEVLPDGTFGPAARVPLTVPFSSFFTATPRAGSPPSSVIDVLGEGGKPGVIRYARIRIRRGPGR